MKIVVAVLLAAIVFVAAAVKIAQFGGYALLGYSGIVFVVTKVIRELLLSDDTNDNLDNLRLNIALVTGQWLAVVLFAGSAIYVVAKLVKDEEYGRVNQE